jgi:glucose 1-dehydrogenase
MATQIQLFRDQEGAIMANSKLINQTAIVTGSDSGIGQAIAIAFANEGADVAVTYFHDLEGARKTQEAVQKAGRKAVVVHVDVRQPESVARLFDEVQGKLGMSTILVNSAGTQNPGKPIKDMPLEDWDNQLKTDLYGPFFCCQQFIRRIDGSGKHGVIINITTVHEEVPWPGAGAYAAAKGGLRNLTRTLALELADKNINVNNIAPGMVFTPMNQQAIDDPEYRKKAEASIPMKRGAQPQEIARAAVFLASEDARYVQGISLTVDGALLLNTAQGA